MVSKNPFVDFLDGDLHIMIFRSKPAWTLDDWVSAVKYSAEMAKEANAHVEYVIYDMSESQSIPYGFLSSLPNLRPYYQPHTKRRVLIGVGNFVKSLLRIIGTFSPYLHRSFVIAESLDDARKMIEEWKKNT